MARHPGAARAEAQPARCKTANMSVSAKAFIKRAGRVSVERTASRRREGAREFFRRHNLRIQQPVPLAVQHFILMRLAASGFVVPQIARRFDPYWSLQLRADQGAARRGMGAVRRGVLSAFHALGTTHDVTDLLVDRRRNTYDVCFLCECGSKGMVRFHRNRVTYHI